MNAPIVWFNIVLLQGVLFLIGVVLAIWLVGNARDRWRQRTFLVWESQLVELIYERDSDRCLEIMQGIDRTLKQGERHAFARYVLGYFRDLRGEGAERLRVLLRSLGYQWEAVERLRARSRWTRMLGAQLLGELRSEKAVDALIAATRDRDGDVSFTAAFALLRIGTPRGIEAVARALSVREDWNQSHVMGMLPEGGSALAERSHQLLKGGGLPESRTKVLVELMGIANHLPATQTLLDLLATTDSDEIRASLLRNLGRMEVPEVLHEAVAAMGDPLWVIRSQAAFALGRVGDVAAVPYLRRALDDREYWVRFNAATALARLGNTGRQTLQPLAVGLDDNSMLAREALSSVKAA